MWECLLGLGGLGLGSRRFDTSGVEFRGAGGGWVGGGVGEIAAFTVQRIRAGEDAFFSCSASMTHLLTALPGVRGLRWGSLGL